MTLCTLACSAILILAPPLAGQALAQNVVVFVKKNGASTGVSDIKITVGDESKMTNATGRVVIARRCNETDEYTATPRPGAWYIPMDTRTCANGTVNFTANRP